MLFHHFCILDPVNNICYFSPILTAHACTAFNVDDYIKLKYQYLLLELVLLWWCHYIASRSVPLFFWGTLAYHHDGGGEYHHVTLYEC